ncbi:MAG: M28 family peptidase [Cyanobacteria bacterium P01_D01_bin.105]
MLSTNEISARLSQHLRLLPGPRDPFLSAGKHTLTQQYLRTELARWGEVTGQSFTVRGQDYRNWQIKIAGTKPSLAPILVGAHYDTVPGSPGADDNASGLAILLLLAELLHQSVPHRSIYLIAFDLEEYGLQGSIACAKQWKAQQKPLHLMISLEMLGYFTCEPNSQRYPLKALSYLYPNEGNFLALVGNATTIAYMRRIKIELKSAGMPCQWLPVLNRGKQIPAVRRSDHAPFWDEGYRAILVTDTAELRNPYYHTSSDRIETLDVEQMSAIAQGLFNYLVTA